MKVDVLNIFLMIISMALALLLPFEVFLISYAILGPLHYLTEISWLQKKQYFVPTKKDYWLLLSICFVTALLISLINLWPVVKESAMIENFFQKNNFDKFDKFNFENELFSWAPCLVFLAFISAFITVFVHDWWFRINAFVISFVLILMFKGTWNYTLIFGILLTTVIHVWVFTGIFILSGAMKNRSISGYASFAVFLICSLAFAFFSRSSYVASNYAITVFNSGTFAINEAILRILNLSSDQAAIINSPNGLKIQGFLAFAYTYHYLNWFSKIDVIKWNKVPKKFLFFSGVIWISSMLLYAYDYVIGFYFLLFLSLLHVFLEFPLNFHSIRSLTKRA